MIIKHCKVNHLTNPLGYHLDSVRISWCVEECTGKKQEWARIQISLAEDMKQIIYDTGEDQKLSSLATEISIRLEPRTRYFYTVQVMADDGDFSISNTNWFETDKMDEAWTGHWIGAGGLETENPIFYKRFTVDENIKKARIYVCGLGVYELFIDDKKIGNEFFAPYCNNYDQWIQYQTYEVVLAPGMHEMKVSIGNGWYRGKFGLNLKDKIYGEFHKLRLDLVIDNEDGLLNVIGTDSTWNVCCGDIIQNDFYDGEVYCPNNHDNDRHGVECIIDDTETKLIGRMSLPVVIMEKREVTRIIKTPKGETVLDFGQNMVGFVEFINRLPKGRKVRMQFGEILQNGNFFRDNLRTAKAEYTFISDGNERLIRPSFTYYGFRYVKIEGFEETVNLYQFKGCVLYSQLDETGFIETNNSKVNQLIQNAKWGQKGNYVDVPTDCPQRDERMGWTGDTQVFAPTACYFMDSYAFLNKYLFDLKMTQKQLNLVTNVIPAFDEKRMASCGWGDAATIIPWVLYEFYGDKYILIQQYESMKGWVDSIRSIDNNNGNQRLWKGSFHFGDWLGQDNEDPNERFKGGTDDDYIASAYYFYSTTLVAKAAHILGNQEDSAFYSQLASEVKNAIWNEYFTPNGKLAINTQTAYVLALYMDFCPEGTRDRIIQDLKKKLKMNKVYLKTGFIGTAYICKTLSDIGANDYAYQLLLNEDAPSWLYAVNLGATTIWERWNSLLPDGNINGTDMNSFNHYSYGSIVEWMFRNMAGIKPNAHTPGYKHILLKPQPNKKIKKMDAVFESASGVFESHWEIDEEGMIHYQCTVPFDATALLSLPDSDISDQLIVAGTYKFSYLPKVSYLDKIDIDSCLSDVFNNNKAKMIIEQYVPQILQVPLTYHDNTLKEILKSEYFNISEDIIKNIDESFRSIHQFNANALNE